MPAATALTPRERELLGILLANRGRVLAREELGRQAGLTELHDRRCDNVLVRLRERLGSHSTTGKPSATTCLARGRPSAPVNGTVLDGVPVG